ncbi:MAG: hypothetical protein M3Y50_14670, partial [Acidobacteriota bacterium]|nr:hypothetical protein [Acidobacteriota bacterium]
RYDVPIQPRVGSSRQAAPRFASEPESGYEGNGARPAAPVIPVERAEAGTGMLPELLPVAASVFDDDFFQPVSAREERPAEVERHGVGAERFREAAPEAFREAGSSGKTWGATEDAGQAEPVVRTAGFGHTIAPIPEPAESDELDIPAFLRRGN